MRLKDSIIIALFLLSSFGCSLVSDFSDYTFGSDDESDSGGTIQRGDAGSRDSDASISTGQDGGDQSRPDSRIRYDSGETQDSGKDTDIDAWIPECDDENPCDNGYTCEEGFCIPIRASSGVVLISGGGAVQSESYKARVAIGMSQPMGIIKSPNFIVSTGPGAGRP